MADATDSAAVFARQVLHAPLWAHQQEAAECEAFITVIPAARRTGKSTLAEVLAIWTALRERAVKVIILSATQESSRRMTESIAATLNGNRLTKGAVVDDFATRIKLTNGSEIISLPASQKQIRGFGKGVKLLVIDEAGFVGDELWQAAHYVALDERANGSRILLLGTPWGGEQAFFRQAYMAGLDGNDPDYASFNWKYTANPALDHRYLERQRERVSPQEYAAEVLGEWGSASGSLFSHELLESVTADLEIPPLPQLAGPARGIIGCDWGLSYDVSAATAIFRLPCRSLNPDRPRVATFVALPYTWRAGAELYTVVTDIVGAASNFACISTETNGIGAGPSQDLRRRCRQEHTGTRFLWNFVNTTAASKTVAYTTLLGLMQRGQLVLPRHPLLLRQLAGVRFEVRARGVMGINTDEVPHDDVADSLMMAALPYRPPTAHRYVCRLASLADSDAPDERVPDLDCPVVATGGGLRVYQVPPLQGVLARQPGLSTYAEQVPPEPEGVKAGRWFFNTTGGAR
jgi:hypothetical protein